MNKYYFTFPSKHVFSNHVQPIVASSMKVAMDKMFELFGKEWAIDYTEEQWIAEKEDGFFRSHFERDTVYCTDVMTIGEMAKWTERFNQILGASQVNKERRLRQMKKDLEQCYQTYGSNQDIFATSLYCSIWDELEVST